MSEEMRVFLAFAASTPVLGLLLALLASWEGVPQSWQEFLALAAVFTGLLLGLTGAAGFLYFVWTWAL